MLIHLLLMIILASMEPTVDSGQNIPWPIKLGASSLNRSNQIPLIDQVVLVPDSDTFIDEIAHWSPAGQWPVLIQDDHFAPMFIRRFKPSRVYQRAAVQKPDMDFTRRCELALKRAWGVLPNENLKNGMERIGIQPLGLVITSRNSKSWPAALALAMGRGQELVWLEGSFGGSGTILSNAKSQNLTRIIREKCQETGLAWDQLGDELDAITICRNLPSRARMDLPSTARVQASGQGGKDEPLAITDLLGRMPDGRRYAMVGWINGNYVESAYIAMCSLFIKQESVWLCNGYLPDSPLSKYGVQEAARILAKANFNCTVTENANLRSLRAMSSGGVREDLILVNSKGNRDFFDLGRDRGTPNDVPMLSTPAALQMIHSWSLQDPSNSQTVGGRWLDNGVYAYIGSSHEPMLAAFVPPEELARRLTLLVPFLIAGRWWDDQSPFSKTWRVNTIGDPLMTIGPPALNTRQRVPGFSGNSTFQRGVDLRATVIRTMEQIAKSPNAEQLTQALRGLDLLGDDETARKLWVYGQQHNITSQESAAIMLGPLFRMQDTAAFAKAWPMAGPTSQLDRDMLWQLLGFHLSDSTDEDVLLLLESEVKGRTPSTYIEILGPQLAKRFGTPRVMALIKRAEREVKSGQEKRRLEQLYRTMSTGR